MIQEHIVIDVPMLWTLQLGRVEEVPPLSANKQVTGGQALFTDSRGAGHELKRMSLEGAFISTDGLYSLIPRS